MHRHALALLALGLACVIVAPSHYSTLPALRADGTQRAGGQVPERAAPLLTVDFLVVSRDGTPVEDVRPEEVTLRVGGRIRPIRSLQFVSIAEEPDPVASAAAEPLPPAFGTNAESGKGRALVLAIDDDSFRPGREAPIRNAVDQLIASLEPQDRLSLVTMPYGGVKVPFTTDHTRVRRALTSIVGHAPAGESGSALACRTRETLGALLSFLQTLGIREEPATVMFVTGALAAPRRDAPLTLGPGICELQAELFTQVAVAAGAARAQFYVIQPGDALERYVARPGGGDAGGVNVPLIQRENIAGAGYLGSDNPIEGIEHLAGVTGGKMLQLTGSAETALVRVLRENSARYVAAIDPGGNDRSGRSQQLDVRVSRSGVEVRSRPTITFPKPEPSLGRPTEPSPRDMLGVIDVFRDLPLRAGGYTAFGEKGKSMRVVTLAEPVEPGVKLAQMAAGLFNDEGKLVSSWVATSEELQRSPVIGAIPVEPGGYRLRVAAIDMTGRAGTVDYELSTETARTGPLKLSSVLLGLSREGQFVPKLQFTNEPVALAYLELYGGAAGSPVRATLEIARTLNGPALLTVPLALQAAGENHYVAQGAVPIGGLPPGEYSVRALVALEGHPMTRVSRTLSKDAPPK